MRKKVILTLQNKKEKQSMKPNYEIIQYGRAEKCCQCMSWLRSKYPLTQNYKEYDKWLVTGQSLIVALYFNSYLQFKKKKYIEAIRCNCKFTKYLKTEWWSSILFSNILISLFRISCLLIPCNDLLTTLIYVKWSLVFFVKSRL